MPRTVLADLGVIAPESSWVYYVLALGPFGAWLGVALFRRSGSPVEDHLVAGTLYGLSLAIVHEVLWAAGASLGQHPTHAALALAERLDSPARELVIGLGVGLTASGVAVVANRVRAA